MTKILSIRKPREYSALHHQGLLPGSDHATRLQDVFGQMRPDHTFNVKHDLDEICWGQRNW